MNSLEWTTAVLTRSELSATEKLVALAIGHHGALKGECWPSLPRLATECSLHRLTVIRATRKLEAIGLIHRTKGRTGKATHYVLSIPRTSNSEHTGPVTLDAVTSNSAYTPTKKLSGAETRSDEQRERQSLRAKQIAKLTANGLPVDESSLDEWVSMIDLAGANGRKPGWAIETMAKAGSQTAREGRLAILRRVSDELRQERQSQAAHEQSSE